MKEINTPEFDQIREHLKLLVDETPKYLTPFFEVRMFELELQLSPSVIIVQAFPKSKPEKAQIFERSYKDFSEGIIDFFSHLENNSQEMQFEVAYEFLEAFEAVIQFEQSKIWEYIPNHSCFDELYNFISHGFTYIIFENSSNQCLIVHAGYID